MTHTYAAVVEGDELVVRAEVFPGETDAVQYIPRGEFEDVDGEPTPATVEWIEDMLPEWIEGYWFEYPARHTPAEAIASATVPKGLIQCPSCC